MKKFFQKSMQNKFVVVAVVLALLSTIVFSTVVAETPDTPAGNVLKIDLTTPNSVYGAVEDADVADLFLGASVFDLGLGGTLGAFGYDETESAAYVKATASETLACGTRVLFYSKHGTPVNGSDYRYMKVRFKSKMPITAATTVALRDMETHWAYYGAVNVTETATDWTEVVIDFQAPHALTPKGNWSTASMGTGNTFCLEILDQNWANSYVGNTFYFSEVSFYEKTEDLYPEPPVAEEKLLKIDLTTPNSVYGAVEDADVADLFLGASVFDLGLGGTLGAFGYDETESAAYVKATASETLACGTRILFYSKHGTPVNGSDYRYMKVRFKSKMPITATTTVALRDMETHWAYYGAVNVTGTATDWTEVIIDFKAAHALTPAGDWSSASIGTGNTFCLEILDQSWANSYVGNTFYLSEVSFCTNSNFSLENDEDDKEDEDDKDLLPEKNDVLELKFNTANAVKGAVADAELSDYYLGKAEFDLGVGGGVGTIGFNEAKGAVFAKAAAEETLACGTRLFIYAKDGVDPIKASDYSYMKVRLRSKLPLNKNTTLAVRDAATHWNYYAAAVATTGTGWTDIVIDLNAPHSLTPQSAWKDAVLGVGDTFCLEILDQNWANSYAYNEYYIQSVTFFADKAAMDNYESTIPNTGDNSIVWIYIMAISVIAMGAVVFAYRKIKE